MDLRLNQRGDLGRVNFQAGLVYVRLDCLDRILLLLRSDVFDLAGAYPLRMRVRGVLTPNGTADDDAVFCDVKTAWLIEGIGHGHQDLSEVAERAGEGDPEAEALLLPGDDRRVVANAAVPPYLEVTDDNIDSFHFHGDPATFPVSAVLVVPGGERERTLLLGRFVGNEQAQALIPLEIVGQLMEMVFRVQRLFDMAAWIVAGVTALLLTLVILLTLDLRRNEMDTMHKLGGSRFLTARLQLAELAILIGLSGLIAGTLAWLTSLASSELVQRLVLSFP